MNDKDKRVWDESDFDAMSWHDNSVHALTFDPEEMLARRRAGASVEDLVRWPEKVTPRREPMPRPYLGRLHATLLGLRARLAGGRA